MEHEDRLNRPRPASPEPQASLGRVRLTSSKIRDASPGQTRHRLRTAIVAAAGAGESRIDGPAIRPGGLRPGPGLAGRARDRHRRGPRTERHTGRQPFGVSAAPGRSHAGPRRHRAGPGDEPAGTLLQGLASPAGTVRHLRRAAGRPGRRVRSQRSQRSDAVGTQGHDERGRIAHDAQSPGPRPRSTRRNAARCFTACRWAT